MRTLLLLLLLCAPAIAADDWTDKGQLAGPVDAYALAYGKFGPDILNEDEDDTNLATAHSDGAQHEAWSKAHCIRGMGATQLQHTIYCYAGLDVQVESDAAGVSSHGLAAADDFYLKVLEADKDGVAYYELVLKATYSGVPADDMGEQTIDAHFGVSGVSATYDPSENEWVLEGDYRNRQGQVIPIDEVIQGRSFSRTYKCKENVTDGTKYYAHTSVNDQAEGPLARAIEHAGNGTLEKAKLVLDAEVLVDKRIE